jgi:UDP-N-acetylmuramoylalanine--D-glutamate ligase
MPTLDQTSALAIWGFGAEGRAAFDFITARYPLLPLTILNDTPLNAAPVAAGRPVSVLSGADIAGAIAAGAFDLILRSPGISPYRPEMRVAKALGIRSTSVTNLWFEQNTHSITIAVTGTKGKSTTARLIHHLLRSAGRDADLLGNVGIPALGPRALHDYTVLELSSYQIVDLAHAPDFALVTNLYPEHTPWHGSIEQYYADKLRLVTLDHRTKSIFNYTNAELRSRFATRPNARWFNAASGFRIENNRLYHDGGPIDCSGSPLKGEHNLVNLAAACTLIDWLGMEVRSSLETLNSFRQLPHRLQELAFARNILCVNDSIATIPEATIAALKTYPHRDSILLLGGTERAQDYTQLYDFLCQSRVRSVFLLPPNGQRIFQELRGRPVPFDVIATESLAEAVAQASARLSADSLLLLSPAAPSFGAFADFEERGTVFEALCRAHLPAA